MKKLFTIFVLAAIIILSPAVYADDASGFYSIDVSTHGDWVGVYGSDGYFIAGSSSEESTWQLPEYAALSFTTLFGSDPGFWTWYDSSAEVEVPEAEMAVTGNAPFSDSTASARRASCFYDADGVNVIVTLTKEAYVTVYTADYDNPYNNSDAREGVAVLYDKDMNKLAEYALIEYQSGTYLTFKAPAGTSTFEIASVSGANSVVLGVFFDTAFGVTEEETTPAVVETPAQADEVSAVADVVVSAPQTGDISCYMLAIMILCIGTMVIIKKQKAKS